MIKRLLILTSFLRKKKILPETRSNKEKHYLLKETTIKVSFSVG